MDRDEAGRVVRKIARLESGLVGDVVHLKSFQPEYRLRVGDYRVLFEVQGDLITIHRVLHRSKAYER